MGVVHFRSAAVALGVIAAALVEAAPLEARQAGTEQFLPVNYTPCGAEGSTFTCTGVAIFGNPELNRWSPPVRVSGTVYCDEATFPEHLPGYNRQCWCKDLALTVSGDFLNKVPIVPSPDYIDVTPGLQWSAKTDVSIADRPQSYDILKVDTIAHRINVSDVSGGLKTTPMLAQMVGAIAAVNGGFHAYGSSVGTVTKLRIDGRDIVTQNTVTDWDLQEEDVEGVFGISAGGQVSISSAKDTASWQALPTFLHSGPLLLLDGVRQPLDSKNWNHVRNPRTCVCTLADNTVMLVTVDGRYPTSSGMTLPELQLFLIAQGCKSAVNLDGGGSTTMYLQSYDQVYANGVVNEPRDKPPPGVGGYLEQTTLRSISNAIVVM